MLIYRKNYKTNTSRKNLMLRWCGKDYIETLIELAIENEEIALDKSSSIENNFYHILNKYMEIIWDYFWEDICSA